MDLRRAVITGLLLVVVVWAVYTSPLTKGLFLSKRPTARAPVQAATQAQTSAARAPGPKLSEAELVEWRQRFANAWRRDPFFTAEEERALLASRASATAPSATAQRPASLPSYKVKMVLISGDTKLAAIDGRVVGEGEMLGDERVVEIQPDGIVLERAGQRRRVGVAGGAVPLIEVGSAPEQRSERR
ncbi:MAG: hypothetical protein HY613_05365 [Candidatus Rokubacteria bacterium]|nr:hypothetical protein [Candidatus Rokubacteria bacterium]